MKTIILILWMCFQKVITHNCNDKILNDALASKHLNKDSGSGEENDPFVYRCVGAKSLRNKMNFKQVLLHCKLDVWHANFSTYTTDEEHVLSDVTDDLLCTDDQNLKFCDTTYLESNVVDRKHFNQIPESSKYLTLNCVGNSNKIEFTCTGNKLFYSNNLFFYSLSNDYVRKECEYECQMDYLENYLNAIPISGKNEEHLGIIRERDSIKQGSSVFAECSTGFSVQTDGSHSDKIELECSDGYWEKESTGQKIQQEDNEGLMCKIFCSGKEIMPDLVEKSIIYVKDSEDFYSEGQEAVVACYDDDYYLQPGKHEVTIVCVDGGWIAKEDSKSIQDMEKENMVCVHYCDLDQLSVATGLNFDVRKTIYLDGEFFHAYCPADSFFPNSKNSVAFRCSESIWRDQSTTLEKFDLSNYLCEEFCNVKELRQYLAFKKSSAIFDDETLRFYKQDKETAVALCPNDEQTFTFTCTEGKWGINSISLAGSRADITCNKICPEFGNTIKIHANDDTKAKISCVQGYHFLSGTSPIQNVICLENIWVFETDMQAVLCERVTSEASYCDIKDFRNFLPDEFKNIDAIYGSQTINFYCDGLSKPAFENVECKNSQLVDQIYGIKLVPRTLRKYCDNLSDNNCKIIELFIAAWKKDMIIEKYNCLNTCMLICKEDQSKKLSAACVDNKWKIQEDENLRCRSCSGIDLMTNQTNLGKLEYYPKKFVTIDE